ncbi:MAG: type III-A CRISPR-associated RAMP protein Csm4 [Fimbriimonadales bacterium]
MVAYHLRFRSPVHLGERGIGQEEVRNYVPADTLFSALCVMHSLLYGSDSLTEMLSRYNEKGREPFFLTSAFPFAGEVRFYPKPLQPPNSEPEDAKRWKSIRWVSERVFQSYLQGEPIDLQPASAPNSAGAQLLLQDGELLIHPEERDSLQPFWDYENDDLRIYRRAVVPRVTLDRITSSSQIWHFGEVHFAEGCGLWFGVEFGEPSSRVPLESCLRLLGDTGLGGERGAGRGLFQFEQHGWQVNTPNPATRFVTLSPWLPATLEERQWLQQSGSAYELTHKYGWLSSPTANNLRRKEVWMVTEGSVIDAPPQFRIGQLVDLSPDLAPHPIYRYGYAFPIGVK